MGEVTANEPSIAVGVNNTARREEVDDRRTCCGWNIVEKRQSRAWLDALHL